MTTELKLRTLQRVLDQAKALINPDKYTAEFHAWNNALYSAITKVYGNDSQEIRLFNNLSFHEDRHVGTEAEREYEKAQFDKDFKIGVAALESCIVELTDEIEIGTGDRAVDTAVKSEGGKKVFISHASADKEIVGELIEILWLIGLRHDQVFCTSFPEYGIPLGVNYLNWLKNEITDDALVLFVLSKDFYKSAVCLAEMGATWVLSKNHVPLVVPPLTYDEVKGVVPLTQGMLVNEPLKYNELAKLVDKQFGLTAGRAGDWERSRNKIVDRIDRHIQAAIDAEKTVEEAIREERIRPFVELAEEWEKSKKELAADLRQPNK